MQETNAAYTIETVEMNHCINNPTIMGYLRGMVIDEYSGMSIMLDEFINGRYPRDAKAIIASVDEEPVAWALFTLDTDEYNDIIFDNPSAETYLQVYVKPEYRRQGIGAVLFLKGQELAAGRSIGLSKHDRVSKAFFEKVEGKKDAHERN